jgi:hypothetical protein
MMTILFFSCKLYIVGHIRGYFDGAQDVTYPFTVSTAKGNLGVKKIEVLLKIPRNAPLKVHKIEIFFALILKFVLFLY